MPGFYISNVEYSINGDNYCKNHCVYNHTTFENYYVQRNTLNKFMNDKAFNESEDAFVIVDGVLLNKVDLFEKYKENSVSSLCIKLYRINGETFFNEFRGSFSGAFYDKHEKKWIIYTNHVGDKALYYYDDNEMFIVGSQINYVLNTCKRYGIKMSLNEKAVYYMLTYAFMGDNSTYANEIKRLTAGEYLRIINGKHEVLRYHTFRKNSDRFSDYTDDQLVDEIESSFSYAVKMEYDKDEEYGYSHMADLSGGLDSRMNIWVAHEQKKRSVNLFTYCKANYLDELIAKEIAYFWKDEINIRALDDCSFLFDIDIMTLLLGTGSLYAGPTGHFRELSILNMEKFGLNHTGQVGDAILGSFGRMRNNEILWPDGMYSSKLKKKIENDIVSGETFCDKEVSLLYVRGFLGAINTHQMIQNFTEVASPFLDVDFFQLCIDIMAERRIGHNIYKKWILSKHPEAAKFKWEKINDKITFDPVHLKLWHLKRKLRKILFSQKIKQENMNPIDYWMSKDSGVTSYMYDYYQTGIEKIKATISGGLLEDMQYLYENGTGFEKIMVLTAIAAVTIFFINGEVTYGKEKC